ncbi:MAG: L,D-transpeptidase, partial [Chloroflexota bacterium]|nr:L,D-transpeptidase [Chloroflexota bacterium]
KKVAVKRTPGYQEDDFTGRSVEHLDLVQIYETEEVDDWYWYKIAPEEWIFQTAIAKVTPNTTPPAGVNADRWIEINLYEQTLSVYEDRELIFATLVATGTSPTWTYPGLFQIYEKLPVTEMRGGTKAEDNTYYLENVPWTMYFDDRRALHGAYWRPMLGFPQSHGCVNLSIGDARWLYDWAELGDWIYVWDPTGKTPLENGG